MYDGSKIKNKAIIRYQANGRLYDAVCSHVINPDTVCVILADGTQLEVPRIHIVKVTEAQTNVINSKS